MSAVHVEDLAKPDPQCVHFLEETPELEALPDGVNGAEIDASEIGSKEGLLDAVAATLDFPDYFGRNWDALDECLRDLSWLPAGSHVLVVRGAQSLWAKAPEAAGGLVESWLGAAAFWAERDVGFHLVFAL